MLLFWHCGIALQKAGRFFPCKKNPESKCFAGILSQDKEGASQTDFDHAKTVESPFGDTDSMKRPST